MSDLLSPIYVVFDADEADAFWGLVGVMGMMVRATFSFDPFNRLSCLRPLGLDQWLITQESNFLRDQSGMKRQLSTLQRLIGVMDPELYAHLGTSMTLRVQRSTSSKSNSGAVPQLISQTAQALSTSFSYSAGSSSRSSANSPLTK
jgi:hypothetical protein